MSALHVERKTRMQRRFAEREYAAKKKVKLRDRFLGERHAVTPSSVLMAEVEPFYPKREGRGRAPIGLERMGRMSIAQPCVGLSEEGIEEAIDDRQAIRGLVGMDLAREAAPYATTLLNPLPARSTPTDRALFCLHLLPSSTCTWPPRA